MNFIAKNNTIKQKNIIVLTYIIQWHFLQQADSQGAYTPLIEAAQIQRKYVQGVVNHRIENC